MAVILEFTNMFVRTLEKLWEHDSIFDGLDMYAGIDLDSAKIAVRRVTNGLYTVKAGSAEMDYMGLDSSGHITIVHA